VRPINEGPLHPRTRRASYRVVRRDDRRDSDADAYRLLQAEALLREAGFIENDDGTWHPVD